MSANGQEPDGRNYLNLPAVICLTLLGLVLYAGYWLLFGIDT